MSTKTSIKRIALVAAAALTLGGFSAVEAHAYSYATANTVSSVVQDATTGDGGVGGVAGPANSLVVNVQQAVETGTAKLFGAYVTVSGAGATISAAYDTATTTQTAETSTIGTTADASVTIAANGLSAILPGASTANIVRALRITTPVAGTITVNVYNATASGANPSSYDSVADATLAITVNATAVSGTFNIAKSTFYDTTTVGATATASLTSALVPATAGARQVTYTASLADANGVAMLSSTAWSVTMTGPGSIAAGAGTTTTGGARVLTGTGASPVFSVFGDGTSGVTVITLSVGSTVFGTKTVTWYGSTVASLTATVVSGYVPLTTPSGYAKAANTATTPVAYVIAKDANGNVIPSPAGLTVTPASTAIATAAVGAYDTTNLWTPITVTGVAEGSTTLKIADSTGLITTSVTINVTSPIVAAVTTSTDASAYDPGTAVKYTISATDAAGNPIADGTYSGFLGTLPTTNVAVQGFSESTTVTFAGGKSAITFYSPLQSGNVSVTGGVLGTSTALFATAQQGASLADATFAVNGSADASAATDAANAATDAANAAADAADNATQAASEALAAVNSLATTVASLIAGIKAQITSLTNLITKIKNKVGA